MFEMTINLLGPKMQVINHTIITIDDVYQYLSVEGHLEISHNKQIVFSEDVAAVEFYWYIFKWYRVSSIEQKIPFSYNTIEHVEPILYFSHFHDQLWKVDSPWMKTTIPVIADEHALESQVYRLIGYIEKNLGLQIK